MQRQKGCPVDVCLRICIQRKRWRNRTLIGILLIMQRLFGLKLQELRELAVMQLTIGTRGSRLAIWQANWVKSAIESGYRDVSVSLKIIKTTGDKILDVPLARVGGKGLFVKEIEEALLDGRIDVAVHSMKDMPVALPEGLCIGAVPKREDPLDVLISKNNRRLSDLPKGARIGTSSLRRLAQLKHIRPDFQVLPLRGNLDTRIQKLKTGNFDAVVLAAAGVKRLGFRDHISEYLPPEIMLPAVGQGALCIETRKNDPGILRIVAGQDHPETRMAVQAERAFLKHLEGGCQVPIAAFGQMKNGKIHLTGLVADIEGKTVIRESTAASDAMPEGIGVDLAERLLKAGAGKILETFKTAEKG